LITDLSAQQELTVESSAPNNHNTTKTIDTVLELFSNEVSRVPNATAVVFEDEELSYVKLDQQSNQIANYLRSRGVGPEVRVGILMNRSPFMVGALLGILKTGGAYVPLDQRTPHERLRFIIEDSGVAMVLTQTDSTNSLIQNGVRLLLIDEEMEEIVRMPTEFISPSVAAQNAAYVIYTSGSTGQPKAVVVPHKALTNQLMWLKTNMLLESDRVLQRAILAFDASVEEIFSPLTVGAQLVLAKSAAQGDLDYLIETIEKHRITFLDVTPSLLRVLLAHPLIGSCRTLRRVFCGGEQLPVEVTESFFRTLRSELFNGYGPTETTVQSLYFKCSTDDLNSSIPIGYPVRNTEIHILDEKLCPVQTGESGELCISGDGLARGYLNRPGLTAERFVANPFGPKGSRMYRTGDLARQRADGCVEFVGRNDAQVKLRGYRIEIREIEIVLAQHPEIEETKVLFREGRTGHHELIGYIVERVVGRLTNKELKRYLNTKLPNYMVPSEFVFLGRMPLLPNGKLDYDALPEPRMLNLKQIPDIRSKAPRNQIEEQLVDIWADLLRVELITPEDDFFELGGNSLLAAQAVSRINVCFSRKLSVSHLFGSPTVASLSKKIEEAPIISGMTCDPPLCANSRKEPIPLSFSQEQVWYMESMFPANRAYNYASLLHLKGPLSLSALRSSLQHLVDRHEILRTGFEVQNGHMVQVVMPSANVLLTIKDISAYGTEQRWEVARQLVKHGCAQIFDLKRPPLIQWILLQFADQENVLIDTQHHFVHDGWSVAILLREFMALYEAFELNRPSPYTEPPPQFADFAVWQRELARGKSFEQKLAYWMKKLGGRLPLVTLPADHPRPLVNQFRGGVEIRELPLELIESLTNFSHEESVTLFMTMLSAFKVLLHLYTMQNDIVVGSTAANRKSQVAEHVVGMIVNPIVLRTDLSGNPTFRELLSRVKQTAIEAYDHQDVPFTKIVEVLKPERALNQNLLYQVSFDFHDARVPDISFGGLKGRLIEPHNGSAKFDLGMICWPRGAQQFVSMDACKGLTIECSYNSDLFDASTITTFLEEFEILLLVFSKNPMAHISDFTNLSQAGKPSRAESVDYWTEKIAGVTGQLQLPTDRHKSSNNRFSCAEYRMKRAKPLYSRRPEIGLEVSESLDVHLLSAFAVVLSRYGSSRDIVIALPQIKDSRRPTLANVVGLSCLPVIRVLIEGSITFSQLLSHVTNAIQEARPYRGVTVGTLRERLALNQSGVNPTLNVSFLHYKRNGAAQAISSTIGSDHERNSTLTFELELRIYEHADYIELLWLYDANLFDPWRIEEIALSYGHLLDRLSRDEGRLLEELVELDRGEQELVIEKWNAASTDSAMSNEMSKATVATVFESQASTTPDALAVVWESGRDTYRDLNVQANQLAHELIDRGVGREDIVGVFMSRSAEMIRSLLGIVKAGAAYLPLDPGYPAERLQFMIEDARPSLVLTTSEFAPRLPEKLERIILDDDKFLALLTKSDTQNPRHRDEGGGASAAYIPYTSGSTGVPKAVVVPHGGMISLVRNANYAQLDGEQVILQISPLSFDLSTFEIWGSLLNGGKLVLLPNSTPELEQLGSFLQKHGINTVWLTAGLFHLMVNSRLSDLGGIKQLLAGGDVLSPRDVKKVMNRFPSCRLVNGYGPTETTTFSCCHQIQPADGLQESIPIGRPVAHTQIYVLGGRLECTPLGVPGELYISGIGVSRGYLARPALTAERFVANPFGPPGSRMYRTGDLVRWGHDGVLDFLGRVDRQVKVRGFRVELGEIESELKREPTISDAVVLASQDSIGQKRIIGYVVPGAGRMVNTNRIIERLKATLPTYMVPAAVIAIKSIPITANGKIDERELKRLGDVKNQELNSPIPADELVKKIANIWREVLRQEVIDINDNFFDLGGNSLLLMRLHYLMRQSVSPGLRLMDVFDHPNIASLAAYVAECKADGNVLAPSLPLSEFILPMRRPQPIPLSSAQRRFWDLDQSANGNSIGHNLTSALILRGELKCQILSNVITKIIHRHESLRTHFSSMGGVPQQVISKVTAVPLPLEDLGGLADEDQEAFLIDAIRQEETKTFSLASGPVIRFRLFRMQDAKHVLLRTVHHIAWDGWSEDIFNRELFELYAAYRDGTADQLNPPAVQYADYAAGEQAWLNSGALLRGLTYWRQQLAEPPEGIKFPTDRTRPAIDTFDAGYCSATLIATQLESMKRLCETNDVSLYMFMLTAFGSLLSLYAGQTDLLIGTPVANRLEPELENLIGLFANTVIMRIRVMPGMSFRQLLAQVRITALDAYQYQYVPINSVMNLVVPRRSPSDPRIYQAVFAMHNLPGASAQLPGLSLDIFRSDKAFSRLVRNELVIDTSEEHGEMGIRCFYKESTFAEPTMRRLLLNLIHIVDSMCMNIDAPIDGFSNLLE
jgi:amino acid adenylation domain-containing protein